jgi:hypothetical protein
MRSGVARWGDDGVTIPMAKAHRLLGPCDPRRVAPRLALCGPLVLVLTVEILRASLSRTTSYLNVKEQSWHGARGAFSLRAKMPALLMIAQKGLKPLKQRKALISWGSSNQALRARIVSQTAARKQQAALYVAVPDSKSAAPAPPNLREASTGSKERCGTCKMFDSSQQVCWGYGNYTVLPIQVCDSFAPETELAPRSDPEFELELAIWSRLRR